MFAFGGHFWRAVGCVVMRQTHCVSPLITANPMWEALCSPTSGYIQRALNKKSFKLNLIQGCCSFSGSWLFQLQQAESGLVRGAETLFGARWAFRLRQKCYFGHFCQKLWLLWIHAVDFQCVSTTSLTHDRGAQNCTFNTRHQGLESEDKYPFLELRYFVWFDK